MKKKTSFFINIKIQNSISATYLRRDYEKKRREGGRGGREENPCPKYIGHLDLISFSYFLNLISIHHRKRTRNFYMIILSLILCVSLQIHLLAPWKMALLSWFSGENLFCFFIFYFVSSFCLVRSLDLW